MLNVCISFVFSVFPEFLTVCLISMTLSVSIINQIFLGAGGMRPQAFKIKKEYK